MKIIISLLLLFAIFPQSVFAADSTAALLPSRPVPFRYVNDYANILTSDQQNNLEAELTNYYKESTNQIVVVILDSTGLSNLSPLGDAIIDKWKIGSLNQDRGVLILVDFSSKKVIIDLAKGIKNHMYEGTTFRILDYDLFPQFKQGKYYEGLSGAINDLKVLFMPLNQVEKNLNTKPAHTNSWIAALVILIMLGLYFIWGRRGNTASTTTKK